MTLDSLALLEALTTACSRLRVASTADQVDAMAREAEHAIDSSPEQGERGAQAMRNAAIAQLRVARDLALDKVQLRAALDKANLARESLLASVSHDLRNPLNTLAMSTGLLRDDLECDSVDVHRALDLVARMDRATTRMRALIDDLLEASRVASGNVELRRSLEPALPLVRDAVAAANVHCTLDENDEKAVIRVDRARMLEALGKVLAFAAKITGDAGTVRLGALGTKDEVVLTAHAQPTRGAHAPVINEGSGGVGLLVARRLIELQGGTFRFDTSDTSVVVTMVFPTHKE